MTFRVKCPSPRRKHPIAPAFSGCHLCPLTSTEGLAVVPAHLSLGGRRAYPEVLARLTKRGMRKQSQSRKERPRRRSQAGAAAKSKANLDGSPLQCSCLANAVDAGSWRATEAGRTERLHPLWRGRLWWAGGRLPGRRHA